MKKLMVIFMVILAVCMTANAQTFSENFTGLTTGINLAGQSSWTKGGTGPDVTVANTTPLTYPAYTSGGGEYIVLPTGTATTSRVYKTFTTPVTGLAHSTFYYSMLLRLTAVSASANGYFMSLGNSGTGTQYGGKLFARSSGAGFNIGISKTSNTAAFGASVLNLNTTYLIVARYSFNKPGFGTDSLADDEAYLWVNPISSTEPSIGSAECAIASGTGGTDFDGFSPSPVPYDVGNIVFHSRNATNPVGAIDGIRVGYGTSSALAWTNLNAGLTNPFDNPSSLTVKNAEAPITLDGKLDEADWNGAPSLLFGNGAFLKKQAGDQTVTGGADVKASFDSWGVTYHLPNIDSSWARVKFLRKGMDLFIGVQSNDKSICKFDWEGEGIFLQIKDNTGVTKEYKLYYQNIDTSANKIKYEEAILNSGAGAGFLPAGSTANDTTNVDNGYSAELRVRLDKLGYTTGVSSVQMSMNIFDPDGIQYNSALAWPYGMMPFDSLRGSYYKSWWGSEWGDVMKTLNFTPEVTKFDNPSSLTVKNAEAPITLDGKLDEADWNGAPSLLFGNGAFLKKQAGDQTVTGGADVKASFDSWGVTYHIPNKDSSWARVKFLRKGMDLFIGVQSNDKSICKFDWEGEGIFLQIKDNAGVTKEYKLYYQNIDTSANKIKYEEAILNSGAGAGFLPVGSTANDTTNVDNGYSAELRVRLDKLGYTTGVSSVQMSMNIFDPDGIQYNSALAWPYGMMPFDSLRGSYYKSWWGSEWGDVMKTLNFTPEITKFDNPSALTVKNADAPIILDGKLDEADWNGAPSLLFGNGAFLKKQAGDQTVTGGADVKASFDSWGVTYHLPNIDSSWARVKFLRKGMDLFIGVQSNDKSICKFDWEGEGIFLQIKDNAGVTKEYKLYYQNIDTSANKIKYEEAILNSGAGAGFLPVGSTANDTTNVDNGYSAELRVRLDKLGYTTGVSSVQMSMNIFDPDGIQYNSALAWPYGMMPFDSLRGSYYKSWWGSEWGDVMKTLNFTPEITKFDNPSALTVKNAEAPITLDGKLDEADWNGAPSLLFGNGAFLKKQAGDQTVTGGADVKASFDSWGVTYHIPNKDSSWARVKFLRKGMDLFIGVQSNDKSICKFDWEGEGIFLQIKDNAGVTKEYKLYYQNIDSTANTIKYEEAILNSGAGAGFLPAGSTANDTTNVDNGYSGELRVRLDKLGYTAGVSSVQMSMNIFDPDGIQYNSKLAWPYGMMPFDSVRGSYYKSWWGSEWGDVMKTLNFTPEITKFDNPAALTVKNAGTAITLDGKLDEADWNGAPSLLFGNGAFLKKQAGDQTVTGGADVKASFDSWGVTYHLPNKDSSWARVKFLRKGMDLFIGVQSNDKSICKFDWEGEGIFLQIKDSANVTKEYKLYYQNIDSTANTIKYEEAILSSGAGAGFLPAGSTANDTTNVDNGYSAELRVRLDRLGYKTGVSSVQMSMNIFDPDGIQYNSKLPWPYGMMPFDSLRGSYYKSWWGSEWGDVMKTLNFTPEYDNPDSVVAVVATGTMTLDGKLSEADWANASTLVFGPANAVKTGTEKTVSGGADVKGSFDSWGVTYHMPYKDTSFTRVKFLVKGMNLYIGIQSPDKSICKFDWEGDGLFVQMKDNAGVTKEYKLYYQNIDSTANTIKYEEGVLNSGSGAGSLVAGSTVNDTTNVDNGYTAELMLKLGSLGYDATTKSIKVSMNIFDPDGFQYNSKLAWPYGMMPFDSVRGSYFKSWWGSEWGDVMKTIILPTRTGVEAAGVMPTVFALSQNYPNPFNPSTVINFEVPEQSNITLSVYDVIGREVATLAKGAYAPGRYNVVFNAQNRASGMYIYRMTGTSVKNNATIFTATKKLMLLK